MEKPLAHKLIGLVNDKILWEAFEEFIDTNVDYLRRQNDNAPVEKVRENQGAIANLAKMKHLRDEVNKTLEEKGAVR